MYRETTFIFENTVVIGNSDRSHKNILKSGKMAVLRNRWYNKSAFIPEALPPEIVAFLCHLFLDTANAGFNLVVVRSIAAASNRKF